MLHIKDHKKIEGNPTEGESTGSLLDRHLAAQNAMSPDELVELSIRISALSAEQQGPPGP